MNLHGFTNIYSKLRFWKTTLVHECSDPKHLAPSWAPPRRTFSFGVHMPSLQWEETCHLPLLFVLFLLSSDTDIGGLCGFQCCATRKEVKAAAAMPRRATPLGPSGTPLGWTLTRPSSTLLSSTTSITEAWRSAGETGELTLSGRLWHSHFFEWQC